MQKYNCWRFKKILETFSSATHGIIKVGGVYKMNDKKNLSESL